MPKSITILLRGISQVFLQNNALTGFIFLIGIFLSSPLLAFGAVVGTVSSTLFADMFGYDNVDVESGLYGYNGTLVGIAIFFFFKANLISTAAIIGGALLSAIFMHRMIRKIPELTAPFVMASWIVLFLMLLFKFPLMSHAEMGIQTLNIFQTLTTGFSQVMLQNSAATGLCFFIGILLNSPKDAGYALYGSILGAAFALIIGFPVSLINIGIFGYNAVLTGIALGGKNFKSFLLATLGILFSVLIYFAINHIGLLALTAPFVLACWVVVWIRSHVKSI